MCQATIEPIQTHRPPRHATSTPLLESHEPLYATYAYEAFICGTPLERGVVEARAHVHEHRRRLRIVWQTRRRVEVARGSL